MSIREIALMGILLALYTVIKFLTSIIFKGPLNFSIELLFWIFNGIIFGPIKGAFFSIVCDTVFQFATSGIAYWMIEYAIVAPLVSIFSWLFWKTYKENSKTTIILPTTILFVALVGVLVVFSFELVLKKFRYEGISSKNIIPWMIWTLMISLSIFIMVFVIVCLILFKTKKDWKYIKWIHSLSLIVIIVIVFRWIWGPYAYIQFSIRFFSKHIDIAKQYPLTLFGIVSKSCITIPLASIILVPSISIIDKLGKSNLHDNKFE